MIEPAGMAGGGEPGEVAMGDIDGEANAHVSRRRMLVGTAAAGVGVGALAFPSLAAAATAPHVNVQDEPYNARGDGTTSDTSAFLNAIAATPAGGTILVPPGTYRITRTLPIAGKRLVGTGLDACIIRQDTVALSVLSLTSDSTYVADLTLTRTSMPREQSVPNGVGIRLSNLGDRSVIERCLISNCTSGIYCAESSASVYVYSVGIRDLRIERFTHSGMYLSARSAGNTGCVLQNIYIINREGETRFEADYGLFLGSFAQVLAQQINVEWGAYGWPITVNSCDTALIQSVNLEGCVGLGSYGAFLSTFGAPNLGVRFSNVAVVNAVIDDEVAPNYALYRMDGQGRVALDGVHVRETNRVGTPTMIRVYAGSLEGEAEPALSLDAFEIDWEAGWVSDYYTSTPIPVLRQENDWRLWAKGVIVHGEDAEAERPPWYDSVEWIGRAEPRNAEEEDTWVRL
jgi:Pectate lyase superfamily protein